MDFSEEEKKDQSIKQLSEHQCCSELIWAINEQCRFLWNIHFGDSLSKDRSETRAIQGWGIKITLVKFPGEDKLQRLSLFISERHQRSTMLELHNATCSGVN